MKVLLLSLAAASAVFAAFPDPNLVARWVASDGTDRVGQPLVQGDDVAAIPSTTGRFDLTQGGTGPSYVPRARGCHASMQYDSVDGLVTNDVNSELDPAGNEWLFFAVGKQTGTSYGAVFQRMGSSARQEGRLRLQRGLAFTISAAMFDNYNRSIGFDSAGVSKASDVLNTWSTWMVHLTPNPARVAQQGWIIDYYDNNDDTASSGGGITGYTDDRIDGPIRAGSVPFALGARGGSGAFTGELLEAGIVRGRNINRTLIQEFLDDAYHLTCPAIAPAGSSLSSQVTTPAIPGRDDRCSQPGSPWARDGSSCTQTCAGRANRVAGTTGHVCAMGSWSGAPAVCESTCKQLTAPEATSLCYQIAFALSFDSAEASGINGYPGLLEGPLRQLVIDPPLPPALRAELWALDTSTGRLVTQASSTCETNALPSLLAHSNPLWASFLSASSAVSVDVTVAFTASTSPTGTLGVATRVRDVNNYYRLTVSLVYPSGDAGTDPATAVNATVQLESVQAGNPFTLASGAISGSSFSGTQPLRLRLWVQQATLAVYAGPRTDYPSATPTDAPSAYGFGPRSAGGVVSPVAQGGAGSVPTTDPVGWTSWSDEVTSLTHGEATVAMLSAGSGWFDDFVVGTDCQAGRACQFGASTMQCVHSCAPGYQRANGTEVRSCAPGNPGADGVWSGEALRCVPEPPQMPSGLAPFTVPENSVLDTPVGTPLGDVVSANNTDITVLFSFEGTGHMANGLAVFKIAGCSGQIFVDNGGSANLDHEGQNRFVVKVVATPNGEAGSAAHFDIIIDVTDVDEAPVLESPANRTVIESAAPGSAIGAPLVWTDPDCPILSNCPHVPVFKIDNGEPLGWDSASPTGGPVITIANGTGQLMVGPSGGLDYETVTQYVLTVRATSPADPTLFTVASVTVYIADGPDAPIVPANQQPMIVTELDVGSGNPIGGQGSGSFTCGNVTAQALAFGSFFACDPDEGDTVTYTLLSRYDLVNSAPDNSDVIRVDTSTGALSWGAAIPDLSSRQPSRIDGVSVTFAMTISIRVTDSTSRFTDGKIDVLVLANATSRPTLSALRALDAGGTARPVVPATGAGYTLEFTGSGFLAPGVNSVRGGSCVVSGAEFKAAQPVLLTACSIVSDTIVSCDAVPGAGQNLQCNLAFSITDSAGTRDVNAVVTTSEVSFNYQPPVLQRICSGDWPTLGGGLCVLNGTGFGFDLSIVQVDVGDYGSSTTAESAKYQFRVTVLSVSGTGMVIRQPELYGRYLYFRVNVGGGLWSSSSPYALVAPPRILALNNYGSTDTQNLDTYSRQRFEIVGENLGPLNNINGVRIYPTGCLSTARYSSIFTVCSATNTRQVLFGEPSPTYACFKDTRNPHTRVYCSAPRYAGALLDASICTPLTQNGGTSIRCSQSSVWTIPGGVAGRPTTLNTVSFAPPSIISMVAPRAAGTEGGEKVIMRGYDFGPVGFADASARYYHPDYPTRTITATSCSVTVQGYRFGTFGSPGSMECLMAEMRRSADMPIATDHVWVAVIGGQVSAPQCCSSYGPPILSSITGDGADGALTTGGQDVVIGGKNFGPVGNEVGVYFYISLDLAADDSSGPDGTLLNGTDDVISIGDGTGNFKVQPAGGYRACRVSVAHFEVTCVTPEAAGSQLRWEVFAYNRSSVPPLTAYAIPSITAVLDAATRQPLTNANPTGGDRVAIIGLNFGPPGPPYGLPFERNLRTGPMLEWVRYGSPGRWRAMHNITLLNHTEIHGTLGPGVGSNQEIVVEVAGQSSDVGSEGARFSFQPPHLINITQVSGPPVPANVRSGNAADSFRIRGVVTNIPDGYGVRVSFGNDEDASRVQSLPAVVSFEDDGGQAATTGSPMRNAEFEFSLPAGAGAMRLIRAEVVDPLAPASAQAVAADGACVFSYNDPVLTSFKLTLLDSDSIPDDVFFEFRTLSNVYLASLVGEFLSDPALDAVPGSGVMRSLQVNVSNAWLDQSDEEGRRYFYPVSWSDREIVTYVNLDRSPDVFLRAVISGLYPSDAPADGTCAGGSPGGETSTSTAVEQTANLLVTRSRPGVSGLTGIPPGGFQTAGGQKVDLQVLGPELFKAINLRVAVRPDPQSAVSVNCPVMRVTASAGNWGDSAFDPASTPVPSSEVADFAQKQCAAYYGITQTQVGSLPPGSPCSIFCVSPEGQGSQAELGFLVDTETAFGSATPFPYAKPEVQQIAAGRCVGSTPTMGTLVQASLTSPGSSEAGAIVVPSDFNGLLRIVGENFGTRPEVWFFQDNPNDDRVDSYVRDFRFTYTCESFSHDEIVVRVPRGWGRSRKVFVRAPPGELQVAAQTAWFNYEPPVVNRVCIMDPQTRQCATDPEQQSARQGSTMRVYFDSVGFPDLLSSFAITQYMPMSIVVRSGAPVTNAQSGLTPGLFCGEPPVDPDGHRPIMCSVAGAPQQDEFGVSCPPLSDPVNPHSTVAQRIPATAYTLIYTEKYIDCTLEAGAGANMEVQVAVGDEVSPVFASAPPGGRRLAGEELQVSYIAPSIASGFTMSYDPSQLAANLASVVSAQAAQAGIPAASRPTLAELLAGDVTSLAPDVGGTMRGPTTGGYLMVLEGMGFGRDYALPSAPVLAAAAKASADVPAAAFAGTPPSVPLKLSCVFASANWSFTRTPGNSAINPSCNGAEDYQGEGEAADASYLASPASQWQTAMKPSSQQDDVYSPVVLLWSDTAVVLRVPPGVGGYVMTVKARGRLSNRLNFHFNDPVISSVVLTAPMRALPAGIDPALVTSLDELFLDPSDFDSDDATQYVELPAVPVDGAISTDGEQVIVIRGSNFGPVPPFASNYASMPPTNSTKAIPRPVSARFPASVVAVWGSGSCATGYYSWDARGFAATVQKQPPAAVTRYFATDCLTRVEVPLAVYPGRLVSNMPLAERLAVLSHTHDRIVMRAPPGVGQTRTLSVVVHNYDVIGSPPLTPRAESNPVPFAYQRPLPRFTADPNILITDEDVLATPITVYGRSMGRAADQPPSLAFLNPGSPLYNSAAARRLDGGWDEGGVPRDPLSGTLELTLAGRACLQPSQRLQMASQTVQATALGESGVTAAVTCPRVNTSRLAVGFTQVGLDVAGQASLTNFSVFVGCKNAFYGRPGQTCRPCPPGADCAGMVSRSEHAYPLATAGYYDLGSDRFNIIDPETKAPVPSDTWLASICPPAQASEDVARGVCVVPCFPPDACIGNNDCSPAYSSYPPDWTQPPGSPKPSTLKFRCAYCNKGYYRRTTECEPCPESPLLLIAAFIVAIIAAAGLGLYLSSRNINVALLNTGVDTFQVLALFSSARISWPPEIKAIFEFLSVFNLNIEITAPECLIPSLSYESKWWMVMTVPILTMLSLLMVFFGYAFFKRCIKGQRGRRKFFSHVPKLVSSFLVALYIYYVLVCRKVMDVFDCEPVPNVGDDALYMAAGTLDKCGEPGGLQSRLEPFAVIFLLFYVVGFPATLLYSMYRNRFLIATDQLLRAKGMGWERHDNSNEGYQLRKMLGRVYFAYKPEIAWIWVQAILMRKFFISLTAVLFDNDSSFILTSMALVLIICYAIHVRHLPFMSPGDRPRVLRDHMRKVMEGEPTPVRMQKAIEDIEARQKKATRRMDWADPTAAGGRMSTTRRSAIALASSALVDYNVVEGTMLFCTILVSLCGILLNTERFEGTTYGGQRDVITWVVIFLIMGALVYFFLVFAIDMHTGVQEAAVRAGKMRPQDVRPPLHAVLAACGCSDLPAVGGSDKGKGEEGTKAGKSSIRQARRRASMKGFIDPDEVGDSSSAVEMTATTGSAAGVGTSGGMDLSAIQASANPLFGLQAGAASTMAAQQGDSKAGPAADGAGTNTDDDVLGSSTVGGGAQMSELKRMTANVLSMTHPPSTAVWPDIQQLFADLASQVEAHSARTRLDLRSRETGAEASGADVGVAGASRARKMLRGGARGPRTQFGQARLGSRRQLGTKGVSMRDLETSRAHSGSTAGSAGASET